MTDQKNKRHDVKQKCKYCGTSGRGKIIGYGAEPGGSGSWVRIEFTCKGPGRHGKSKRDRTWWWDWKAPSLKVARQAWELAENGRALVDRHGKPVTVGNKVRLIELHPWLLDGLPDDEVADVSSMVGEVFEVTEVLFRRAYIVKIWQETPDTSRAHGLYLEAHEMEVVR